MALPVLLALVLGGCGSGGSEGSSGASATSFASTDEMRLKVTDMVGSSCDEAAEDITGGTAMTCDWDGKSVLLATFPSEKQAQSGAEYYTGTGEWTVAQEGRWVVGVTGDQPDLDALLAKVKA